MSWVMANIYSRILISQHNINLTREYELLPQGKIAFFVFGILVEMDFHLQDLKNHNFKQNCEKCSISKCVLKKKEKKGGLKTSKDLHFCKASNGVNFF
jgi:hypothetical protein